MSRYAHVMGLNRRELELIAPLNPRPLIRNIAGSKVKTKRLLEAHGVPVPRTFAVIEDRADLRAFDWALPDDYALKPSGGGRGCGIIVTVRRVGDAWQTFGGELWTRETLRFHLLAILSGDFSREGRTDIAHFEQRMRTSIDLTGHPARGLPDVRVIIREGRPVMAMTRIPTDASGGKANLHQGAVGVGIDIPSGETLAAVQNGEPLTRHPDTGAELIGKRVPAWSEIVTVALKGAQLSGLGYTGVDLVLDDDQGPVILEINARPGLDIQIANGRGLRDAVKPDSPWWRLPPGATLPTPG